MSNMGFNIPKKVKTDRENKIDTMDKNKKSKLQRPQNKFLLPDDNPSDNKHTSNKHINSSKEESSEVFNTNLSVQLDQIDQIGQFIEPDQTDKNNQNRDNSDDNNNNNNNDEDEDESDGWRKVGTKNKKKPKIVVRNNKIQNSEMETNLRQNSETYKISHSKPYPISHTNSYTNSQIVNNTQETVNKVQPDENISVLNSLLNGDSDIISDIEDSVQIIEEGEKNKNLDKGTELKFKHSWKIYVHKAESNDWSIESFDKDFYTIDSVSTFLQFFNNFYKFNSKMHNFFIMKSQDDGTFIEPTWEHKENRNGGICSIRIDSLHGVELMQQLCMLMMNECLIPNMNIINGISYGVKTNWALIKIWTNDKVEDISKLLPNAVVGTYCNINVRYRLNVPEY